MRMNLYAGLLDSMLECCDRTWLRNGPVYTMSMLALGAGVSLNILTLVHLLCLVGVLNDPYRSDGTTFTALSVGRSVQRISRQFVAGAAPIQCETKQRAAVNFCTVISGRLNGAVPDHSYNIHLICRISH